MDSELLKVIRDRIEYHRPRLMESNSMARAEELFCACNQGFYKSPNFSFCLAIECAKAVGYRMTLTPENQLEII